MIHELCGSTRASPYFGRRSKGLMGTLKSRRERMLSWNGGGTSHAHLKCAGGEITITPFESTMITRLPFL